MCTPCDIEPKRRSFDWLAYFDLLADLLACTINIIAWHCTVHKLPKCCQDPPPESDSSYAYLYSRLNVHENNIDLASIIDIISV